MADEIQRLRELLAVADADSQAQIKQRVDALEQGFAELPAALPEALQQADQRGPQLAAALETPLHRSIEHLARKRRDLLAHALYPVLGPAIRKAVTEALRQLVENLNRLLESTFTVRGMRWRLESWRSGVPYAQVALRHLLRYSVEHLFLVQNGSGLLLARAQQTELVGRDTDAVAAMLTAIRDFSRDSGLAPEDSELHEVSLGEHLLRLYPGPEAYLTAAISGAPGSEIDASLAELLEQIHVAAESSLVAGEANSLLDSKLKAWLEQSGQAQALREEAAPARPWFGLMALVALIGMLLLYTGEGLWTQHQAAGLAAVFDAEPGFEVRVERAGWRSLRLRGLRDPLARTATEVAAEHAWSGPLQLNLKPYLALDDVLQRRRLIEGLDPPSTVQLELRDGRLSLLGQASAAWIEQSRSRLASWPGLLDTNYAVRPVEQAPPPEPSRAQDPAPEPIVSWDIGFDPGATSADATAILDDVHRHYLRMSGQLVLRIEAETDGVGSLQVNQQLALERADWVMQELLQRGVAANRLVLDAVRPRVVAHADAGHRRVMIRVAETE